MGVLTTINTAAYDTYEADCSVARVTYDAVAAAAAKNIYDAAAAAEVPYTAARVAATDAVICAAAVYGNACAEARKTYDRSCAVTTKDTSDKS